jgi:hypothetical protein
LRPGQEGFCLAELLEYQLLLVGRNTAAGIADGQLQLVSADPGITCMLPCSVNFTALCIRLFTTCVSLV